MRHQMLVRDADENDVDDLARLWAEAGSGSGARIGLDIDAPQAIAQIAADPDQRMLVSEQDGRVVAAMHALRAPISPLHLDQVVHTSYLLVLPEARRHGHARALLEAVVAWAEEKGVAHVTAITDSSSRDTNRFFARLGLATFATVRVAPTGALRKKLSQSRGTPRGRGVPEVLAARRTMRRRTFRG